MPLAGGSARKIALRRRGDRAGAGSLRPADARLSACVNAGSLRPCDPFGLPLPPHVGFELREDGQHGEEGTAGRRAGIDALLDHLEVGAAEFDLVGDVRRSRSERPSRSRRVTDKCSPAPVDGICPEATAPKRSSARVRFWAAKWGLRKGEHGVLDDALAKLGLSRRSR